MKKLTILDGLRLVCWSNAAAMDGGHGAFFNFCFSQNEKEKLLQLCSHSGADDIHGVSYLELRPNSVLGSVTIMDSEDPNKIQVKVHTIKSWKNFIALGIDGDFDMDITLEQMIDDVSHATISYCDQAFNSGSKIGSLTTGSWVEVFERLKNDNQFWNAPCGSI